LKKYIAEFIGTFLLVFVGVWSIEYSNIHFADSFQSSLWLITIAFGLIVTIAILLFGKISGAHINPAVSLGFWLAQQIDTKTFAGYVAAQMTGAVAGAWVFNLIVPSEIVGTTLPSVNIYLALLFEFVLSIILMLVIFTVANPESKYNKYAAYLIGLTVAVNTYVVGLFTSVSMNPARSFGPALVSGHWEYYWVYLIAPLMGMNLAYYLYRNRLNKKYND
jgi:aquaporin Z